jgi:GNAT superfamily N-acetyltransferase
MSVSEDVRVEAHRAAWLPTALPFAPEHRPVVAGAAASGFDAHKFRRAQSLWPYDASRDLVITTLGGEPAGCCTVWLDETTGAAEIEPLGVVPEHRGRGLAIALCHAAIDAVARAGGEEVVIHPRGDVAYPAPRAAYAAAGFTEVNRTRVYARG